MHHYGTTARRHWERWLPERHAMIEDPDSFFSALGQEAARQIADLALDLAGDDPPGEDYLVKVGRLNMARLQAEEIILPEQILPPPEPAARQDDEYPHSEDPDGPIPSSRNKMPMIVDRGHPMWEQVNAEQEQLAQVS